MFDRSYHVVNAGSDVSCLRDGSLATCAKAPQQDEQKS